MESAVVEREARPGRTAPRSAGFAEVAGLTAAAALGACLVLIPLGYFLLPVVALPDPFPDHHQRAETLVFVLAFAAVLPLAVAIVPRLADRVAAVSAGALSGIAALSCAAMAAALPAVKVSEWLPWGDGLGTLLAAMVLWWALTAGLVAGVISGRWIAPLERIGRRRRILWSATAALVVVVMPAFAFLDSISIVGLLVSVLLALVCLAAYVRGGRPVPGGWGKALDVAAVVLLFLVVPNLVIIRPDVPAEAFDTQVIQFHQNFYLGPAGHVLGGGTMLVDTLSQYGVASIDFIAGWLAIVGTSNGMLGLLDGITSALVFVGGYLVVRAAGVGRAMSAVGFLVAVLVLVLALVFPVGALLQHGAIRFGMPMVVLVAAAARLRSERWAGPARAAEILAVGLSSIWALEAFAYTVLTYAAIVAAESVLLPAGERRGHALRLTAAAVAACIVTHVLFAAATLVSSGSLPEWGLYLGTLYEFLAGGISDLTYDFSAWSPGIAVGAGYLVSAVGVCVLIARERERAIAERTAVVLLAGTTAYGVALYSYLVNRSADHIVPYVSLPLVMAVLIWLGLLGRAGVSSRARTVAVAVALGASALLIAVAWSSIGLRFSQSALAHVVPGGESMTAAIDRLHDMPEIRRGAAEAERLLDEYWPDENEALVIVEPDLGVEALARTGKVNVLPLSDPWEDSLVPDQRLDDLNEVLGGVGAGELMLLDGNALEAFGVYRRDPSIDPLAVDEDQTIVPSGLAILQQYALAEIGESYRLETVARGEDDLTVVRLVPR